MRLAMVAECLHGATSALLLTSLPANSDPARRRCPEGSALPAPQPTARLEECAAVHRPICPAGRKKRTQCVIQENSRETEDIGYQYPFSTQPHRVAACR